MYELNNGIYSINHLNNDIYNIILKKINNVKELNLVNKI